MIDFVHFYFEYMTSKAQTNPKTFVKVNVHISGSVKTYQTSKPDIMQPLEGLEGILK